MLVTEDFAQRYPAIVQRVVDVLVKEAAWESDEAHRAELFAIWAKSGYPVAAFEQEFTGVELRNRCSPLLDGFFYARYREAVATSLELKLIRRGFDVDAWLEPKYVDSAVRRLGFTGLWSGFAADGRPMSPSVVPPAVAVQASAAAQAVP